MTEQKRLRAETDRYVAIDAKALDCDPEEDALAHALAAERAHADAEIARLRKALHLCDQLLGDDEWQWSDGERFPREEISAALREEAPDA